jgi:hypothetical protein
VVSRKTREAWQASNAESPEVSRDAAKNAKSNQIYIAMWRLGVKDSCGVV